MTNTNRYFNNWPFAVRNTLPDSLISSAEDVEDCVAKFASLVRARGSFPRSQVLVSYCRFGSSPSDLKFVPRLYLYFCNRVIYIRKKKLILS